MNVFRYLAPAGLILAGVIHLLPLAGVLGADKLQALYGVSVDEPNLELLLRHRAILFGILGGFLVAAAFHAPIRRQALLIGLLSTLSFLGLATAAKGLKPELGNVVVADLVAAAGLALSLLVSIAERRPDPT